MPSPQAKASGVESPEVTAYIVRNRCNRSQPCGECIERKVPYKCKYMAMELSIEEKKHPRKAISSNTTVTKFTPESVAELAATSHLFPLTELTTTPQNLMMRDLFKLSSRPNLDFGWPRRPFLTDRSEHDQGALLALTGAFDPFASLPTAIVPKPIQIVLMQYYISRLAPWLAGLEDHSHADAPRLAWLPYALSHPALFHATLLCSAVHLQRIQPRKLGNHELPLQLKTETLRLLNENLMTSEGPSDEVITTCIILLYWNVGGGNPHEYEIHLKGIKHMLDLRGGIPNLGMRGILKNWFQVSYGPWESSWREGWYRDFIY